MHLILSLVVACVALYYLSVMGDQYDPDTTYLMPILALLMYSVVNIIKDWREWQSSWFADDFFGSDPYNDIIDPTYSNYGNFSYECGDETIYKHCPSNEEVRNKINNLKKSRWFRFKAEVAGFFGVNLEAKYRKKFKKPYTIARKYRVKSDNSRFMPKWSAKSEAERKEYNDVAKQVGRSCEITFEE